MNYYAECRFENIKVGLDDAFGSNSEAEYCECCEVRGNSETIRPVGFVDEDGDAREWYVCGECEISLPRELGVEND